MKNSFNVNFPYETHRFKLFFNKGFLFYAEYNIRLFLKLLVTRKQLLMANDLDTLLPNFLISKLYSCKLIYDSHEYFTEVPELMSRPRVRSFWLKLERMIFPKLKNAITVNRLLADIYQSKYGVKVHVIKNVPKPLLDLESEVSIPFIEGQKIILYQGALNLGRGLELIIGAMTYLENHLLLIAGDGDITAQLKEQVRKNSLEERVTFLGKLNPSDLMNYTKKAALGISLEEDLGLNYRYCLPNKVFDYINAGIPVLVSDLPLLKELIISYKVGEYLKDRSPKSLALLIEQMISNKIDYHESIKLAAKELNWENEKKIFIEFIHNIE